MTGLHLPILSYLKGNVSFPLLYLLIALIPLFRFKDEYLYIHRDISAVVHGFQNISTLSFKSFLSNHILLVPKYQPLTKSFVYVRESYMHLSEGSITICLYAAFAISFICKLCGKTE